MPRPIGCLPENKNPSCLMNNRLLHVFLFAAGASAMAGCTTTRVTPPEQTPEDQVNLFELRTYLAAEGKLPALESRFANHTMALFERHGMKNVAYWRATEKPQHAGVCGWAPKSKCRQSLLEKLWPRP
ncbi:MAG: hypothetical protein VXX19_03245 [Planctomycetota bacterium]|nr:hypothetical protein [Planctomycetota bacterium]